MAITQSAENKLTELKAAMLLHTPFFATLLLDMMTLHVGKFPHLFQGMTPTAATDGKNIWVDEDFLAKCKLPEAVFLICHEVGHAMWQHMSRAKKYESTGLDGKEFNFKKWNFAGDYIINDMLIKSKIGTMPKGGLHSPQWGHEDLMVDDVYRQLPDDPSGSGNGGGLIDQHIAAPAGAGTSAAEWNRAVQSAAENAKAQGKLPASLGRFVDQLLNPKLDWREHLRTVIVRAASRDAHTWAKPHRRRLVLQGVVMPSYTGFGAGEIVVAVDTSGSIGDRELAVFLTEIQNIVDTVKPTKIYVVPCDAMVHEVTELENSSDLMAHKPPLGGGGGTAFEPVFEWVEANGINPASLVYLTDMYGSFPEHAPGYPVVWCSTSKGIAAPFGQVVEIDMKEYQ